MQFTIRIIGLLFCGLCLHATVGAQEGADGPTLQKANPPAAVVEELPSNAQAPAGDDQRWRYRQHDGRWWYWLPSNRWVVWIDGRWVDPPVEPCPRTRRPSPKA